MDEETQRVSPEATGSAPSREPAAVGHRPAMPWRAAVVGVASGVVSGIAAAWSLKPGRDGIALASVLALLTVTPAVAFLVTAGLARAALSPAEVNSRWLASELGLLPLVIIMGAVAGLGAYPLFSYLEDLLVQTGIPFFNHRWLSTLSFGLTPLVVAILGAVLGLWRATTHLTRAAVDPDRRVNR